MIDEDGFRLNVGIVLINAVGQLFWGRRVNQDAWQFPQGGIQENEPIESALYRELHEEVGLEQRDVTLVAQTKDWLTYRLPHRLIRMDSHPLCIGQKQKWFLLQLATTEENIKLDVSLKPEFDAWRWVNYWYPLYQVVTFKREVYRQVLIEFAPIVMSIHQPLKNLDPLD